jgi:microcystin-dependent protein
MTVAVAAGTVAIAGASVAVTGGNVTITPANASNPRFDLICVDNTGLKSAIAGTPTSTPVYPDPGNRAVLAAVRVPAAVAAINAAKIVDKRVAPVIVPSLFPVGFIGQFAGTVAPSGWWLCDGSAISRTTYAVLFSLVGTTFGAGDGSTTFNVPDINGRTVVGPGTNSDVNGVGKSDGLPSANRSPIHNSSHNITLPAHGHAATAGVSDPGHSHADVVYANVAYGAVARQGNNGTGETNPAQYGNALSGTGISVSVSVGNPTSYPGVNGSVGPGGTRPTDMPGFIVLNHMIKII